MSHDYPELMDRLLRLPACALLTTGRTGTDFLQSLFDSHPEVLTFNGVFTYHDFWKNSHCVSAGKFDTSDLVDEFIGNFIHRLKSKYELIERKDQLGEGKNQSIDIDLGQFKYNVMSFLDGRRVDSRNSLLAFTAAYAMCLGQNIDGKKLFLHHLHQIERLDWYLKDFSDSKIICNTRDPRANFVSGILNWRKCDSTKDNETHLYFYIKRILIDADFFKKYYNPYVVLRIEDLGDERVLRKLTEWLGVSCHECMKISTWGGLLWHADRVSVREKEGKGFSANLLKNDWERKLSFLDKYVFNFLMNARLRHYRYSWNKVSIVDALIVPFLIPLPLRFELRFLSTRYLRERIVQKELKTIFANLYYYILRVLLFYVFYIRSLRKDKFDHPYLHADQR